LTSRPRPPAAPRSPVIRGVLFDKDGTLLDYQASWAPANVEAALTAARGEPVLAHRLLRHGGQDPDTGHIVPGSPLAAATNRQIAEHWLTHLEEWDVERLTEAIESVFQRAATASAVILPGVAEALQVLRSRGMTLGVATNDSAAGARASLDCIRLTSLFAFVAGWDSGHGAKPGPGMLEAFCRATGIPPSEVAVVGDNVHDLQMGRNGGAGWVIAVLSGTGTPEVLAPLSDIVVDGVADLPDLLAPAIKA